MRRFLHVIGTPVMFICMAAAVWFLLQTWRLAPDRARMIEPFGRAVMFTGFLFGAMALRDRHPRTYRELRLVKGLGILAAVIGVAFIPVAVIAAFSPYQGMIEGAVAMSLGMFGLAKASVDENTYRAR